MKDKYPTRKSKKTLLMQREERAAYDTDSVYGIREYAEKGFYHYKNFFDSGAIDLANSRAANIYSGETEHGYISHEPDSDLLRSALNIHNIPAFNELLHDPVLASIAAAILGGSGYVHQSRINYKNSYGSAGWDWHSDFETWHSQDGMPEMRAFSAMIPLTENTNENGCLMVVPHSHEVFCSCARSDEELNAESEFSEQKEGIPPPDALDEYFHRANGIVSITCDPGDLVIFDCNTLHVSHPNLTPNSRTNLFFVLNSVENRLVEPFSGGKARPDYMAHRA